MEIEIKIGARRYIFECEEDVGIAQDVFVNSNLVLQNDFEDELERLGIEFSYAI